MAHTVDEKKEQRAVEYLRTQLAMDQPETVLQIYAQIIEQEVFHTQVGFAFLQELKDFLLANDAVDDSRIPDFVVPLGDVAENVVQGESEQTTVRQSDVSGSDAGVSDSLGATDVPKGKSGSGSRKAQDEKTERQGAVRKSTNIEKESETNNTKGKSTKKEKAGEKTAKKERKKGFPLFRKSDKAELKNKKQSEKSKEKSIEQRKAPVPILFISLFLNVVLITMVVVMFVLTLTSDSPNILNYKNQLEDEYASWDEELTMREQEVKKREAAVEQAEQEAEQQTESVQQDTVTEQGTIQQNVVQDTTQQTEQLQDNTTQPTEPYTDTNEQELFPQQQMETRL